MRSHRRYSEEEKRVLLAVVEGALEQGSQPLNRILSELGLNRSVYYGWLKRSRKETLADNIIVPRSFLSTLPEEEEAVVNYGRAHPSETYRRLCWMMIDKDIAYLAPSTVYRILEKHDLFKNPIQLPLNLGGLSA